MKIKVLEGFKPDAGDIKVFNNSESSLVKFAIEAANNLLTDNLSTWHKRIGQDSDNYYEIVLGTDDEDYICIKWAFIPKNSAMNEYGYDYMFPYDEKTGDVWAYEESIAKYGEDNSIDENFVKSAVSYILKDFKKYVAEHNKETANENIRTKKKKIIRKNIKESKMLKEGPGAGYTINWECDNIGNINSYKITNAYKNKYDLWTVEADCDIDMTVDVNSYWSYYYGSNETLENVSAKIYRIVIDDIDFGNLIDNDDVYENMSDDDIENYLLSANSDTFKLLLDIMEFQSYIFDREQEFSFGGGWSHATWDGEIADIKDNEEITAYITDKKVIAFVDKAVQGDTQWSDYELYDQDNEPMELTFESEDEAKDNAEKILSQDERYTKIVCWRNDWKEKFNGETDLVDEDRAFILYADDYR